MANDVLSFRVKSPEILFCFQMLYQNQLISNEQKNQLTRAYQNCLQKNFQSFHDLNVIYSTLGKVLEQDLEPFVEQKTQSVMDIFSVLFEKELDS